MCGIAEIVRTGGATGASECVEVVSRMTKTLSARGPDASGLWADAMVTLGHRRLGILELSDAGAQPMQAGATGPVITYNGEVYNHRELRIVSTNRHASIGADTQTPRWRCTCMRIGAFTVSSNSRGSSPWHFGIPPPRG